jgi:uncharacterized protein YvpB
MVLRYFGKTVTPDNLSKVVAQKGYDRYLHSDLVKLAKEYGITSKFSTQTKLETILEAIDNGNPVILSAYFTASGHIVVVKGYDLTFTPTLILNDPYGDFQTKYSNFNGKDTRLTISDLNKFNYNREPLYWAHLFSK